MREMREWFPSGLFFRVPFPKNLIEQPTTSTTFLANYGINHIFLLLLHHLWVRSIKLNPVRKVCATVFIWLELRYMERGEDLHSWRQFQFVRHIGVHLEYHKRTVVLGNQLTSTTRRDRKVRSR